MVNLVDVLIEEGAGVHQTMGPVMPCVLENEEDSDLVGHLEGARERNVGLEAEVLAHGVEQPDLRELDSEVREEDEEGALRLFPDSGDFVLSAVSIRWWETHGVKTYLLDLVLPEVGNAVDDDPRQRSAKVERLVDDKRHDAGGQNIVAHPCVPCEPHLLKVVERDVVLGDLLEGAPVRVLRHWRQDRGCVPVAAVSIDAGGSASGIYRERTFCLLAKIKKRSARKSYTAVHKR